MLRILPARDIAGAHGKTYLFAGFDEIHAYRSHDLFEALAPDPTRQDVLIWITSYSGIRHAPGIPLFDFMQAGKRGDDRACISRGMAATSRPTAALADATPEQRANPSAESWGTAGYLDQQRRRLPTHKFRRLHLNLPGAPDGAAFDGDKVMAAIVNGRRQLQRQEETAYHALRRHDVAGRATTRRWRLRISTPRRSGRCLMLSISQIGAPPFNPRDAVRRFAAELRAYGWRA